MKVNDQIRAAMVRYVDGTGEQVGVVPLEQALTSARSAGLDLVEVAPGADPPVCRAMDYGKYKYQQAKKAQEGRKKQSRVQVKEIKMRPKIADHDYDFKMKKVMGFLEERNRVKVTVRFRGREIAFADSGRQLLLRVGRDVKEVAQVEGNSKMEGRQLTMILAPK